MHCPYTVHGTRYTVRACGITGKLAAIKCSLHYGAKCDRRRSTQSTKGETERKQTEIENKNKNRNSKHSGHTCRREKSPRRRSYRATLFGPTRSHCTCIPDYICMCVAWEGGGGYYYINHKLSPPNTQSKLWIWFPAFANFGTTTNAISRCTLVYGRTHVCINICACAHICIACMYMGFRRFFSPS